MTRPIPPLALEARSLLDRYPDLKAGELDRLQRIFPRLPILETALMTTETNLAAKLDSFRRDHPRHVGGSPWFGLIVLAIPASIASAFLWAMWQTFTG
jgi:hypothetical protein